MNVCEIFRSRQGEGRLTGIDSVFVRAAGCNLRCRYCDTPYASWRSEGDDLSVEEIADRVKRLAAAGGSVAVPEPPGRARHVVLTGGEPMLFAELIPLGQRLRHEGFHITIETAGTLDLPVACDLMSISPKLSNSTPATDDSPRWLARHEAGRSRPEVVRRLIGRYDYQLKFVADRPEDLPEVEQYLAALPEVDRNRVLLMPQGTTVEELAERAAWIEPYCAARGLTYCPRRQIEWYGPGRGEGRRG